MEQALNAPIESGASDRLALANTRPNESTFARHDDTVNATSQKRPLSEPEKAKGFADDSSSKRTRHDVPNLHAGESIPQALTAPADKGMYDDILATASLLSKIIYPNESFSIPDALLLTPFYNKMSSRCVRVCCSSS